MAPHCKGTGHYFPLVFSVQQESRLHGGKGRALITSRHKKESPLLKVLTVDFFKVNSWQAWEAHGHNLGKLRQKGHHKFEIILQNGGHEIIKFGFHSCSLPSTYFDFVLNQGHYLACTKLHSSN